MIFTFAADPQVPNNALQSVQSANVLAGTGTITSTTLNGMQCSVHVTDVAAQQTVVVSLRGVHDSKDYINVAMPINILVGDTTGNSAVNASDINQVKAASGSLIGPSNFKMTLHSMATLTRATSPWSKLRAAPQSRTRRLLHWRDLGCARVRIANSYVQALAVSFFGWAIPAGG